MFKVWLHFYPQIQIHIMSKFKFIYTPEKKKKTKTNRKKEKSLTGALLRFEINKVLSHLSRHGNV